MKNKTRSQKEKKIGRERKGKKNDKKEKKKCRGK